MTLPLELGQVSDVYARRALEQLALRMPPPVLFPIVAALPATGVDGQALFLGTDNSLNVWRAGAWQKLT